ncbi:hypothetical protein BEWA_020010 [Theileria equi strain WA]|uniref:Uncharacterized protein n=1 Tax=Theileria equi strain WA TaxID=1537102 RepID=L0AUC2_THEEQ|nr:hypothetical protein BEWA_020010 [Theileria equi strain WA]AFZ79155.1 hypothetical protein BEWA_020010 [Theileria equi strain WA]|eukprot:XP_004828821.1 hypothetical protein BEWA_020010 [Theileria equi strain WA]
MTAHEASLYDRKVGGKLKLKGLSKVKGTRKGSETYQKEDFDDEKQILGTGRIVSSSKTIQGFETRFMDEARVNDILLIKHPLTHSNEERRIEAVLSHRTIHINEPFSGDLITTCPFYLRRCKDKNHDEIAKDKTSEPMRKRHQSTVTVRKKTGMWSYKTETKVVKSDLSAEDRLNERIKLSRDKYCW